MDPGLYPRGWYEFVSVVKYSTNSTNQSATDFIVRAVVRVSVMYLCFTTLLSDTVGGVF